MTGPTEAERQAIEAADAEFFETNPGRCWRLRLPAGDESAEAEAVAVHRTGVRVCLAPAPDWASGDAAIEAALRDGLPPAAWPRIEAAINERLQS